MKGQINIVYIGILTLIGISIFGTTVIWNFYVTDSSSNEFNEKQMQIIGSQIEDDINYFSTLDSTSQYTVKRDFPEKIGGDSYCIRFFQDELGNKRVYLTKKGSSLSYNSYQTNEFFIDITNKNLNLENSEACGGTINLVKTQNSVEITSSIFSSAVPVIDNPPSISSISDTSTNEDNLKEVSFTVDDENLVTLSLTATSSNTVLVSNSGLTIPSASGSSRTLNINPNSDKFGTVTITITATDDSLQTYTESFLLTINSVNDVPTISFPGNQIIDVFTSTGLLPFTINDVETSCEFLTLSKATSQSSVIQLSDISITNTGNSCNKNVEVTSTQSGSGNTGISIITLTVSDGSDFSNTNFQITVNNFDSGGGGSCTEVREPEVNCNPPGIPGRTWTDGTYCYDNDACEGGDENERVIGDYCSEPFVDGVCESNPGEFDP